MTGGGTWLWREGLAHDWQNSKALLVLHAGTGSCPGAGSVVVGGGADRASSQMGLPSGHLLGEVLAEAPASGWPINRAGAKAQCSSQGQAPSSLHE